MVVMPLSKKRFGFLPPILGMGFLFFIGITLALILAPIFIQMNARADFSQVGGGSEESVVNILIYISAILVFTGILLMFGKAKKGKFFKHILIGVFGITTTYIIMFVIGYAMYGPLVLIWDNNDAISEEVTFIIIEDIGGSGNAEIILGTSEGNIQVIDSKTHKSIWNSPEGSGEIKQLEIIDMESDGIFELVALSNDRFDVYRINDLSNIGQLYSDHTGEISAFTSGDTDMNGISEIYLGTRQGNIVRLDWIDSGSNNYSPGEANIINSIVNETITAMEFWIPPVNSDLSSDPLLIAGSTSTTKLYHAGNGTLLDASPITLGLINYPIIIETVELDSDTSPKAGDSDKIILIHTNNKMLTVLSFDNFDIILQDSRIRAFGSFAVADLLDKYEGDELLIKSENQFKIYYSETTLWDNSNDFKNQIKDFGDEGKGTAVLEDSSESEIVMGAGGGYFYGEFNLGEFSNIPCFIAIIIAFIFILALLYYPEWYVIDTLGIIMGAGACAMIGISIAVSPIIVFLIALAVYDAISVYKTKHMIDLADNVLDWKLPIILVVPKKLSYSFLHEKRLKDQLESKQEREAMFMGLGDVIIPGTLAVSSMAFLPVTAVIGSITGNYFVAVGTLAGTLFGFAALMRYVLKGRPQAGLPLLNTGAILGYLISYYIAYQDLSFGFKLII
jgi:presenilin-like A22 family membrane protease